ncbi:uncharacterized protein Dwil_GK27318 [Drosophila willistoni]|uniref:Transmembrane protein n=1 Tax=Drosophila willistoni TaxID=7260 RepID=A0A0Q9X2F0_DROWI|nr:uncharacterized protein Dwil_GK27318 [Drosophila willistoni]
MSEMRFKFPKIICWIFFMLLVLHITVAITNDEELKVQTVGFWERLLAKTKSIPWYSNQTEKETPETTNKRRVMWQRLTMASVL